ncbi:MAG: hypothetical protein JWO99_702 [Candidatus Saccharibacteria bacterium]|nr:hypothetical protein [Candidatus Saccharibacteria bacterium]
MISVSPIKSRQRRKLIGILVASAGVLLIVIGVALAANHFQTRQEVRLGTATFTVRLAETDFARKKGLSGVEKLDPNEGLLMVFGGDGRWGIWMKDMKIPLDIIWLDSNKKVIYIVTDASPSLGTSKIFEPKDAARYVLEVRAGTTKSGAIKIGDTASFTLEGDE